MSIPTKSRREQSGTHMIQDRFSQEGVERWLIHQQLSIAAPGGVLPEQEGPLAFQRVLDVGCGPGNWLLAMAQAYPGIDQLVGVDISEKMIGYARAQAKAMHLADRVAFYVMDTLGPLAFPAEQFDLVNECYGLSWLRTWDWPQFLLECQRLARPGGMVRLAETAFIVESNSPTMVQLHELAIRAFYRAGHLFTPESDGLTKELAHLLRQYGLENIQTRAYALEYRGGTPQGDLFIEDWRRLNRALESSLSKWTRVPDDYEEMYRQALREIQQPDFVAIARPLIAWSTRSANFSLPARH